MRIKSIFVLFLLNYHCGSGQDNFIRKNDSLQNLLNQSIEDSLRIKVLEDLHFTWKNINFEKSIEYCKQAIDLSRKSKYSYFALGMQYQLGFAYMQAGDAVRSIEVFQEIVKEVEYKDPMGYSTVLGFIAMNYENQKNYKTALQYQLQASAIYEPSVINAVPTDTRAHLGNPHKLGQYYLKLNQLDSALYYGHIALERLKVVPLSEWNVFFSWYIKTLMGNIQYELKNYKEALHYYGESEKEINENIHALYSYIGDLIPVYLGKSKVFFNLNNRKEAITQARKSFELADTLSALPGKAESADWLKTMYQYEGKLDSALLYYTVSIVTRDSISNSDITRKNRRYGIC